MSEGIKTGNPFVDAWQAAFLTGTEAMASGPGGTAAWTEAMRGAEADWATCRRQAEDWMKAAGQQMSGAADPDGPDGIAEETLRRLLDPTQFLATGTDQVNLAIQRLVEGPGVADIGTLERQVLKATGEWMALKQASAAYKAVTAAGWARAFATFSQETMADPATMSEGPRAILGRWLKVANAELVRIQRTDAFLEAQRDLLTAGVDYRLKERELVEMWCETHSIPTRSEIDEVHRAVHDLKREVRDLKSRLATAAARPAPRRKPAAKKSA